MVHGGGGGAAVCVLLGRVAGESLVLGTAFVHNSTPSESVRASHEFMSTLPVTLLPFSSFAPLENIFIAATSEGASWLSPQCAVDVGVPGPSAIVVLLIEMIWF